MWMYGVLVPCVAVPGIVANLISLIVFTRPSMRSSLRAELEKAGSSKPWEHITAQIGMFCYSGLTQDEVLEVRKKHSVYLTNDGRVSMAGVTSSNVEYLAQAIHDVTK